MRTSKARRFKLSLFMFTVFPLRLVLLWTDRAEGSVERQPPRSWPERNPRQQGVPAHDDRCARSRCAALEKLRRSEAVQRTLGAYHPQGPTVVECESDRPRE